MSPVVLFNTCHQRRLRSKCQANTESEFDVIIM